MGFENGFLNKNEIPNKHIELIENSSLDLHEKMELLLVELGYKQATEIELFGNVPRKGFREKKVNTKKIREVENLLNDLELKWKVSANIDEIVYIRGDYSEREFLKYRERLLFVAGKDLFSIKRLEKAIKEDDHKEMGKCYGYPQTAVDAYLGKVEGIERKDLPEEIEESEFFPFIEFRVLSKDNWKKEIETAKSWSAAIKRSSPKLFGEYVEHMRREVMVSELDHDNV